MEEAQEEAMNGSDDDCPYEVCPSCGAELAYGQPHDCKRVTAPRFAFDS
jgi:hypothetical protein